MNEKRILFIHHSVGSEILTFGRVRARLADMNNSSLRVGLWDHGYNRWGYRGPEAHNVHLPFPIPRDNTYPPGICRLFEKAVEHAGLRQKLQSFDGIVFKSCFPNSRIRTDAAFGEMRTQYLRIRDLGDRLGLTLAVCTSPPMRVGQTTHDEAMRAVRMADWLMTDGPFVHSFDLFGRLAVMDEADPSHGMLRPEFTSLLPIPIDSHPNPRGAGSIGTPFAKFIRDFSANLATTAHTTY